MFQRGLSLVQTIAQPRTLQQMTHAPAAAGAHPDDIEFDVPVLQLPAMAGERSTTALPHVEAGAAGMLQVQNDVRRLIYM